MKDWKTAFGFLVMLAFLNSTSGQAQSIRAYVVNNRSDTVSVIDTHANDVIATVAVGHRPYDVALTPDGTEAYVLNHSGHSVSVIRTGTNAVTSTVNLAHPTSFFPTEMVITPDGSQGYITGATSPGLGEVLVLDLETNTVDGAVSVTHQNSRAIEISPDGARVYASSCPQATSEYLVRRLLASTHPRLAQSM